MNFGEHSELRGKHSLLSASNWHWINDDDEKFLARMARAEAVEQGTLDHEFAALCIQRGQKLPKSRRTLNMYVNDAVGFHMFPEEVLYYSDYAFVTADAIAYDEKNKILRIHDLKTGITPASMNQLMIYAGYFCLAKNVRPGDISYTELRIYQQGEIAVYTPTTDEIAHIMDLIVSREKLIRKRNFGKERFMS